MKYLYVLFALLALSSCKSCNNDTPAPPSDSRTVIAYLLANNNLNSYGLADINEMESAWRDDLGGQLYVFLNTSRNKNILYKIVHDENPNFISSTIVKEYSTNNDPCNADFIRIVINDVQTIAPAKSYGLFLWSHGSGWLPEGSSNPLRSFGQNDRNSEMFYSKLGLPEPTSTPEVSANPLPNSASQFSFGDNQSFDHSTIETYKIAEALQGLNFEYIYFDACHMASVELAYSLRNCAKYTIASTAETLANGAPYHRITQHMFGSKENTILMAKEFYDYYMGQSGFSQSGTISVVENKKLEGVAAAIKGIVTPNPAVPFSSIQQYGRYLGSSADYRNIFYDLSDFVNQTWGTINPQGVAEFTSAMQNAVLYQAATPTLFNSITVKTHCGLSVYIPKSSQIKTLGIYRQHYRWATDSGLGNMVD